MIFTLLEALIFLLFLAPMHSAETLTQFSTINALMQGIYDGPATFAQVRRYGDFGIGTVNHLDGEMLALDGVFYQITSDGRVHVISDREKTSFATVSFFRGEHSAAVPKLTSFRTLQGWLDRHLGSKNYFWSVRIHGVFPVMQVRSISPQHPPYRTLAEVAKSERIYDCRHVTGTLVGFRSPPYIKGINVPGYHFHFLSDDKTLGGHVMACSVKEASARWDSHRTFQMMLPDDPIFRRADLSSHDEAALRNVEQ
jgi:acetolactate decarboxylase